MGARWSSAAIGRTVATEQRRRETPAKPSPRHAEPPARPDTPAPPEVPVEAAGNARFYPSTTKTPDGLCMARLVGYTEQQLQEIFDFTRARHGARPY